MQAQWQTLDQLCRQLGLELVGLSPDLPLFCGVTGARISEEQDKRIEILRDALMDAARSRVEELGEDAVAGGGLHMSRLAKTIMFVLERIVPAASAACSGGGLTQHQFSEIEIPLAQRASP